MSMLDRLPTVAEMMAALASPMIPNPVSESQVQAMELSTDDMIRMMFEKVMQPPAVS